LSKVDHQAIDGNTSRFRLDEQIRSALLLLESKWTERETEFDVELESIEFTGNESMLLHVWSNLIDNAIKYGPRGGLITLRLREEAGQAVFTIEDCGPGIPESHQPHIFDKFYQVESSRTTEGNGLGLALTKRVLDVCGGTIAVENLPTAGCRFTVKLPLNG
jgi:signal transduction histidine kinase